MKVKQEILEELWMLTGKVSKNVNYLYYLLMKESSMFNNQTKEIEVIKDENTVDDFSTWFDKISEGNDE